MRFSLRGGKYQFLAILAFMQVIFLGGVAGYMVVEHWSFLDSVFMTVITLGTVGYGEVHPLSPTGRVFTIALITFGVVTIAAMVTAGANVLVEAQLDKVLGRRRLEKEIRKLKNHYIVCGYGRMGRIICQELKAKDIPLVVIEGDQKVFEEIGEEILALHGDATQDAVLVQAGIMSAKGLVSVVSSDAANVYITLTARGLASGIHIVARAGEEGSETKLLRAGADKVVSPYIIGGGRIASAIIRPAVVDFIDLVTKSEHLELQMEEVEILAESSINGTTLMESGVRQNLDIVVVAIKKSTGHMVFNPSSATVIETGDRLIILGGSESLAKLDRIARGRDWGA